MFFIFIRHSFLLSQTFLGFYKVAAIFYDLKVKHFVYILMMKGQCLCNKEANDYWRKKHFVGNFFFGNMGITSLRVRIKMIALETTNKSIKQT